MLKSSKIFHLFSRFKKEAKFMLIPNLHFNRNDVGLTLEFHYGNF
jgi:hypothetical protein